MRDIDYTKNKLITKADKSDLENDSIALYQALDNVHSLLPPRINRGEKPVTLNLNLIFSDSYLKEKKRSAEYHGKSNVLRKFFSNPNFKNKDSVLTSDILEDEKRYFYEDFYESKYYEYQCVRCGLDINKALYQKKSSTTRELCYSCEHEMDRKYTLTQQYVYEGFFKIKNINDLSRWIKRKESYESLENIDDIAIKNHKKYVSLMIALGLRDNINKLRISEVDYIVEENNRKSNSKSNYWKRISSIFKITRIYCSTISRKIWNSSNKT